MSKIFFYLPKCELYATRHNLFQFQFLQNIQILLNKISKQKFMTFNQLQHSDFGTFFILPRVDWWQACDWQRHYVSALTKGHLANWAIQPRIQPPQFIIPCR